MKNSPSGTFLDPLSFVTQDSLMFYNAGKAAPLCGYGNSIINKGIDVSYKLVNTNYRFYFCMIRMNRRISMVKERNK